MSEKITPKQRDEFVQDASLGAVYSFEAECGRFASRADLNHFRERVEDGLRRAVEDRVILDEEAA